MSPRNCLKPWEGKRVKARGFLRVISGVRDVALVDDVEVELDAKWIQIGHVWVQKADLMRFINLAAHDQIEFTAKVSLKVQPNISLLWPKHIRPLQSHQEPTGAEDIPMTIQTYNLLKSRQRKTEGKKQFVAVNGKWRRVIFVNQDLINNANKPS